MGLDMYLYKIPGKQMNQEEANKYNKAQEVICEYNEQDNFLKSSSKKIKELGSMRKYVEELYSDKIKKYEEISKTKNEENPFFIDNFIYDAITSETPTLKSFKSKERLIDRYENDFKKCYLTTQVLLRKTKQSTDIIKKYEDYDIKKIGYWRKHADLNHYFTEMAMERNACHENELCRQEFNCDYLVLSREDVEELMDKVDLILEENKNTFSEGGGFFWGSSDKDDWIETKDIFDLVLKTFDFEKDTLIYSCWY